MSITKPSLRALVTAASVLAALVWHSGASADRPAPLSAQTLVLPSGPASLKGLGDSFSASASSGTGSFSVPLEAPPGFMKPELTLSYVNGKGKGILGQSFDLPMLQVYRSRDKGAPSFTENDRFSVSGPGINDELVLVNRDRGYYRLKNEGQFVLFVRHASTDSWELRFPRGERAYLGESVDTRQTSRGRSYRWLIERQTDAFEHAIEYSYAHDRGQIYIQEIRYQLHADARYQNNIVFEYEERPDAYLDFSYGSEVLTRRRLVSIAMLHGGASVRTYTLAYHETQLSSLLASVTLRGRAGPGGVPFLPTLRLSYIAPVETSGRLVEMATPPPLEGLLDGRATLDDVNADGLPDILYGEPNDYRYYENRDGRSWTTSATSIAGSPDRGLHEPGTVLVDVDGDGARDVLYPHGQDLRYFPAGTIDHGDFQGFGEPRTLRTTGAGNVDFSSASVRMTDLDADGRIDLLFQKPGRDTRVMNTRRDELAEQFVPEFPIDADFSDSRTQLTDFNGDGELDLVRTDFDPRGSELRVWYGLGQGEFSSERGMVSVPAGDSSEFHLDDVNHDGQADLIRISGSWLSYYLNLGNGRFSGMQGDFGGLPSVARTRRILFGDMNGNGTRDVVWVTSDSRLYYLELTAQPNAGLLARIDNGMGQITDIDYRSSAELAVDAKLRGEPWAYPMPIAVPVITEVRTTDSLDVIGYTPTETRVSNEYRDAYYDGKEREFRGFELSRVYAWGDELHETLVSEMVMHVGRDPETGEDQESLKGKTLRTIERSEAGEIYKVEELGWERKWLCQEDLETAEQVLPFCSVHADLDAAKDELVGFSQQVYKLTSVFEKTSTPRYTLSTTEYDAWGNVTHQDDYGEVSFMRSHAIGEPVDVGDVITATGDDEKVQELEYANDVELWRIGYPTSDSLLDVEGALIAQRRFFYDGDGIAGSSLPFGSVSNGLLTRTEEWLAEESRWVTTTRVRFNAQGLPEATVDARGSRTELGYDALQSGILVTLERMWVESGPLDTVAAYDPAFGTVVSATDANGYTQRFSYDGLGRLLSMRDPRGVLTSEFSYQYGNPISSVRTRRLLDAATQDYRTEHSYVDGAGRVRLVKAEVESSVGFVGSSWKAISARGAEVEIYDPFVSTTAGFEAPPADTPRRRASMDALGRLVRSYAPATDALAEMHALRHYLPFEVRTYDERETASRDLRHPIVTRVDGHGRLREVEKTNEQNGELSQLLWRFEYNEKSEIVRIRDPGWRDADARRQRHERRYTYDSLQRLTRLVDPSLGTIDYAYDDVGNLLRRTDVLGQEQVFEYGLMNRPLARHVRGSVDGVADYSYRLHYDAADPASPLPSAANLLGRLAWVEFPTGTEHYSYDERGRQVEEGRTLWDPSASDSTFESQQRETFVQNVTFDEGNRLRALQSASGLNIELQYNRRDLLVSAQAGFGDELAELLRAATYDARGAAAQLDFGNDVRTCHRVDQRAQLIGVLSGPRETTDCSDATRTVGGFQHAHYRRSFNGLIDALDDMSAEQAGVPRLDAIYAYDALHELVHSVDHRGTLSYRYDDIQNLVRQDAAGGPVSFPTGEFRYGERGAGPNMLTSAGSVSLDYDAVGQLQSYNGYALSYNPEGQLVRASRAGGPTHHYHYDIWGQRRVIITERTDRPDTITRNVFSDYQIRDGEHVYQLNTSAGGVEIAASNGVEVDAFLLDEMNVYLTSTEQRLKPLPEEYMDLNRDGRRFDADDLDAAATAFMDEQRVGGARDVVRYYHRDQLGGTTHTTDSVGDWIGHQRYHPYGATADRSGLPARRGFAGSEVEDDSDLGLIMIGARYYAPDLGRWITPDRHIGESPERMATAVLEANLYSYAMNNPVGKVDPSGKETVQEFIDSNGVRSAREENYFETALWATASGAWQMFGSEEVSRVADNAINGRNDMTTGDYAWAAFDIVTLGKGSKVGKGIKAAISSAPNILRGALRQLDSAADVVNQLRRRIPCLCMVAGTVIATPAGAIAIEDLQVGDRVSTLAEEGDALEPADAEEYRVVALELPNPDAVAGGTIEMEMLRPAQWVIDSGARPGGRIFVALPEKGLYELAYVSAIGDATIAAGEGALVTARFSYRSSDVHTVRFVDSDVELRLTGDHPLYSADRQDWVPTDDLAPGEAIVTRGGVATVAAIALPTAIEQVHDIEVFGEHRFLASELEILSHNGKPCAVDPAALIEKAKNALTVHKNTARSQLRAAIKATKGEAHHIIPWQLREHPLIKKAAEAGWNINGARNGVELARHHLTEMTEAGRRSFHLEYNRLVDEMVNKFNAAAPNLSPAEAKALLESVAQELGDHLKKTWGVQ